MNKNTKITVFGSLLLSLVVSIGCIPEAFQGLPVAIGSSAPNPREQVCRLLINAGASEALVTECLNISFLTDEQINRLCSLSANLNAEQKEILRTALISRNFDVAGKCAVFASPSPLATATISAVQTAAPTLSPTAAPAETIQPTSSPSITVAPTATLAPIPSPSTTPGTGGAGTGGGLGGGSSDNDGPDNSLTGQIGPTTATAAPL